MSVFALLILLLCYNILNSADMIASVTPSSSWLLFLCQLLFQHCPLLAEWASEHETAFANFMEYKFRVPVCGAIILNETMDKVKLSLCS